MHEDICNVQSFQYTDHAHMLLAVQGAAVVKPLTKQSQRSSSGYYQVDQ